jgi:hypothetical protein
MVQFWAHKGVIFVHYCVFKFAYCAVAVVEGFGAVEVCCETVVACVEPEVCDYLFSGFIFVVFPCRFNVLHFPYIFMKIKKLTVFGVFFFCIPAV